MGVIASGRSAYPVSEVLIADSDDGRVSVARTMVDGMTDHVVVHATHPMTMRDRQVLDQTARFPRHGRFDRWTSRA